MRATGSLIARRTAVARRIPCLGPVTIATNAGIFAYPLFAKKRLNPFGDEVALFF
jgi:hypothetical protein